MYFMYVEGDPGGWVNPIKAIWSLEHNEYPEKKENWSW